MGVDEWVHDVDADLSNIIHELNKGFRPTQMTTAQRDSLTNLFNGLLIYNKTTNKLNVYTANGWEAITSS